MKRKKMAKDNNHTTYSAADIQKYWRGELSQLEMYTMEKASLSDPFLADAMDGFRKAAGDKQFITNKDLEELKEKLKNRINQNVAIQPRTKWWRIAAIFILLVGVGMLTYRFLNLQSTSTNKLSVEKETAAHENINTQSLKDTIALKNISVNKNDSMPLVKNYTRERKPNLKEHEELNNKTNSQATIAPPDINQQPAGKVSAINDSTALAKAGNYAYKQAISERAAPDMSKEIVMNKELEEQDKNSTLSGKAGGVVVTGYGSKRKRLFTDDKDLPTDSTFREAMPITGWDEYNTYIEKNKTIPKAERNLQGEVIVTFSVNKRGELSKFKIKKSLSVSLDKEAIRLIKEGPKWKPVNGNKGIATTTIKF